MSLPAPGRMFINGKWCDAADGKTLEVINPATEQVLAEVACGGRQETKAALEAAAAAFPAWKKRTAWERAAVLKRAAEKIRNRVDEIARTLTLEQGKPLAESQGEIRQAADTFEWFAEEAKRNYGRLIPESLPGRRHLTVSHPVGVVGTITPFNFPVTLQARKMAPALAAGCTVVAKPASQTPLSLIQLFECLAEAEFPDGVVNMVIGSAKEISAEFLENPICRKISFTGSTPVGKELMRGCADQVKHISLELGGHAPFIVCPDADPEIAAKIAVTGKFRNNGQVCICPTRFYVHSELAEPFAEAAVRLAGNLKLGNGLDEGVEIGPMFEASALEKTIGLVDDARSKGAQVLSGGQRSQKFQQGYFYEPTVLSHLSPDSRMLEEEPFAPVMPLIDFDNLDDVIAAANNTRYGLAAYAFTNDLSTAWRLAEGLEAGIIGINDPAPTMVQCPFGGMKESGLGRELGREGLEAYLETKYVSMAIH
ncbi:NAD-dependent succinate-semialdehyde dehydrogenase [Lignipirellula cremea]|uniref:Succinate-semialdehyde dehydrogenase [NADP(+)] GabD n=1 Tax=Lignipirellula cremea TaxID=2528010 RepID=A0A518DMT9_9BACT|nr:NAD-dependent succinate-semialdehyde dehydrogenase [Lignipirellula cremea]QDU93157.1 Succinate-semialdehyde dehydrogenase [NADP(+)] GabD [Lignipirellula cremea]